MLTVLSSLLIRAMRRRADRRRTSLGLVGRRRSLSVVVALHRSLHIVGRRRIVGHRRRSSVVVALHGSLHIVSRRRSSSVVVAGSLHPVRPPTSATVARR